MKRIWIPLLVAVVAPQAAVFAVDQQPPAPKPAITALPNPVPADPKVPGATISWTTGGSADGVVRVSVDGGAEQLFAQGQSGSSRADWITADRVFEFRLYAAHDPKQVLASVKVTREQPSPVARIDASPNPVAPGTGLAATTITWTTGDQGDGEVYVSKPGEPERLFARGPSGSKEANWIDRASTYEFKLYATTPSKRPLGTVTLTASEPPGSRPAPTDRASQNLSAYLLWAAVAALLIVAFLRRKRKPATPPRT